jgi:hypothetical protein
MSLNIIPEVWETINIYSCYVYIEAMTSKGGGFSAYPQENECYSSLECLGSKEVNNIAYQLLKDKQYATQKIRWKLTSKDAFLIIDYYNLKEELEKFLKDLQERTEDKHYSNVSVYKENKDGNKYLLCNLKVFKDSSPGSTPLKEFNSRLHERFTI